MSIADSFSGMNNIRLKPCMLQSLLRDHLPDDNRPFPSLSELASVLLHIRTHGLLSERGPSPDPNPKMMEAWRSAIDDSIDRLIFLISNLFTKLAGFLNAKKDATSLDGKVVQLVLNLLNEDGAEAVSVGASDLLCTAISLFPFSVHRHYENVEGVLVSKMKSAKSKFLC